MNRFEDISLKKRIFQSVNFSIVFFLAIIIVFIIGVSRFADSSVNDDRRILTEAVGRDIIHCYAVEGMYPPSLQYMEDNYGLTYDHSKYIVDYEIFGSNIMPTVRIIERSGKNE